MKPLTVLSLFNGMSCGRLALEVADIPVEAYYSSEIDKYAQIVADHNYPQDIEYKLGDVRYIDTSKLPQVDLLIGGSPCQSFSFSGKGLGMTTVDNIEVTTLEQYLELKDSGFTFQGQSYLFWEYVRILKEVNPKYFLLENVVMSKKWEKVITDTLGVEPIMINSALVSAQSRKRLYWTNIPNITQPMDLGISICDVLENYSAHYKYTGAALRGRYKVEGVRQDHKMKVAGLTTQMLELRKDSKTNTLTTVQKDTLVHYSNSTESNYRRLTPIECERLQNVPDNFTSMVSNSQRYKMLGNGWTINVIAHILKFILR